MSRAEAIDAVLKAAAADLGVRETDGPNRGRRVNEILRTAGLPPGLPWCMAAVYTWIDTGCKAVGLPNPFPKTAYCPTGEQFGRDHGIYHETGPERGDVFLVRYGGRARHTGLVAGVAGVGVDTIEGNTTLVSGSAEGIGVFRRHRADNGKLAFVRWADLLPSPPETWSFLWQGKPFASGPLVGGRALAPVRPFGDVLGLEVGWDNDNQAVLLGGAPVTGEPILLEDHAYLPVRDLAEFAGLTVTVDAAGKRVLLKRAGK